MAINNCSNCIYHNEGDVQNDLKRQYFCLRFPPQVVAIPSQHGIMQMSAHPTVNVDMWCGEHVGFEPQPE